MKGKLVFGALLVSVALCNQGYGDLLDNLLGLRRGNCCDPCGQPACCQPAAKCCAPEPQCCQPACEPACEPVCEPCCKPKCDLFSGLKGLFKCKKCCNPCDSCASCCEPAKCSAPEPKCCKPACEPSCEPCCKPKLRLFAKKSCCEPCCEPACPAPCDACNPCGSCCKKGLLGILDGLFCKKSCCSPCDTCGAGCGCGGEAAPAAAPAQAPSAAPIPKAPKPDPSAALRAPRNIYQASRRVATN
jgi:hypothetical protein